MELRDPWDRSFRAPVCSYDSAFQCRQGQTKMKMGTNPTGHNVLRKQADFLPKLFGYLRLKLGNAARVVSQHLLQGFFQFNVCVSSSPGRAEGI